MVLEASYEATLWSTVIHALKHKNDPRARKVFLTALGGGCFGNDMDWIANAIDKACQVMKSHGIGLEVTSVSFSAPADIELE
jgi:hypothetical protein